MRRALPLLLAVLACLFAFPVQAGGWHVAMILDRSGSMNVSDPGCSGLLAPAMLSELFEEQDRFEVFPQDTACGLISGPCQAIVLDPRQRKAFREALLGLPGGSEWEPPFGLAVDSLEANKDLYKRHMLAIVYDGDQRQASDSAEMQREADRLAAVGVQTFVLGLGDRVRGTQLMRQWGEDHVYEIDRPEQILASFADIFRRVLGARKVPQGSVKPSFEVQVSPGATEAWLVVVAEAELRSLRQGQGNPKATRVEENLHGGWTIANDRCRNRRSYQVAHLDGPQPGKWAFTADTSAPQVHYMLLERFDVDIQVRLEGTAAAGLPVPVRVTPVGASAAPDIRVIARVAGKEFELSRQPDGSYMGDVTFDFAGSETLEVTASNDAVEVTRTQLVDVKKAEGGFDCSALQGVVVPLNARMTITYQLTAENGPAIPDDAWFEVDGQRHPLSDDGRSPDTTAADRLYTGEFIPRQVGPVEITAWSIVQGVRRACRATAEVKPTVALAAAAGPVEVGPCQMAPGTDPGTQRCQDCGRCSGTVLSVDLSATRADGPFTLQVDLAEEPPRGVSLFLEDADRARIRPGQPISVERDPSLAPVTLLVCANRCPPAGVHEPGIKLVLQADGGPALGPQRVEIAVPLRVVPSSLWVCWGRTILALAAAALALFVLVGLVRPLRFPRGPGLGQPGFPWNFKCVTLDNLELLTREEDRALRQFATRFTFYRDQRIWIDERWELRRTPQGGRVEVNLKRIDGVPTAWIAALDGVLLCTPFREGAGLPDDAESWEEVPEAGARLKLRHIYLFREDPPKRVFLFL